MSADNTIAVLETPDGAGGFEYRVVHLQAVENVEWHVCEKHFKSGGYDKDCRECGVGFCCHSSCHIRNARRMWAGCDVYDNKEQAMKVAEQMYSDVGYVEYGIHVIRIPEPFEENRISLPEPRKEFDSPISSIEI